MYVYIGVMIGISATHCQTSNLQVTWTVKNKRWGVDLVCRVPLHSGENIVDFLPHSKGTVYLSPKRGGCMHLAFLYNWYELIHYCYVCHPAMRSVCLHSQA